MPELPEVETIRRDLARVITGKRITAVVVRLPKIVRGSATALPKALIGAAITTVNQRGKLLLFDLDTGYTVLVHLKMTGQLFYQLPKRLIAGGHGEDVPFDVVEGRPGKHTHVSLTFVDGSQLHFNDMRQFGYVALVDAAGREQALAVYGPEPLAKAFNDEYLYQQLRRRKTALKNVLLNQSVVAGLGNIYVDEACFAAGIRPMRRADRLTRAEVVRLHRAIVRLITKAISLRGTTFNNYRDARGKQGNFFSQLKVYRRTGQRCKRGQCSGIVRRTVINGRGTHWCPRCQR